MKAFKNLSSALCGRKVFFIFFLLFFLFNNNFCTTANQIKDASYIAENSLILAIDRKSKGQLAYIKGNPPLVNFSGPLNNGDYGIIKTVYTFNNTIFAISENKGIYAIRISDGKTIHLSIKKEMLTTDTIRNAAWHPLKKSLIVTYRVRGGAGATECTFDFETSSAKCLQYNDKSSELKSNHVAQVVVDARGNTWFRYEESMDLGVSRLNMAGEWDHFDMTNAQMGSSSVTLMRAEKKDEGFKGDNVWFVTPAGLSRLQYDGKKKKKKVIIEEKKDDEDDDEETPKKIAIKDYREKNEEKDNKKSALVENKTLEGEKKENKQKKSTRNETNEVWTFYGDKKAEDHALYRTMGIYSWFTDAIVDIVDIEIIEDSILIATKDAIYHFEPKSIIRFMPKTFMGSIRTVITSVFYRNSHFFVKLKPEYDSNYVSSFMIFDMSKKKWDTLDFWKIKKSNPRNITFTPYNSENEIVILKYERESKLAIFKYSDYSLTLIDFEPKK